MLKIHANLILLDQVQVYHTYYLLFDTVHVAGCPTSYHQVQLSTGVITCLELFHSGVRLSRAEEHCQNTNGGHVVTMDTAAKREAVKDFLAQRHGKQISLL